MSRKVTVAFQVNSLDIMRNTLKDMSISFNEQEQCITVKRNYNSIVIDGQTHEISYDSDNEKEVNSIKQNYMTNFYKDQAIREGVQLEQVMDGNKIKLIYR